MRHLLSLVMIVLVFGIGGAPASADDRALCREMRPPAQEVIAACSRIIASKPSRNVLSAALHQRGFAYEWIRDRDRAMADYTEAIRLDPKSAVSYNNRGTIYQSKGNLDLAIADFSEAIRLNSSLDNLLRAYRNRGNTYQRKGDLDRAIADYNEIVRRDPKFPYALTQRASSYEQKGDNDRAMADYNEAVRLDPSAFHFGERAEFYQRKGDLDRAIVDFNEAIRLWPEDADGFRKRAVAYERKGDLDRAIADYTEAIRLDPKGAVGFNRRGSAYKRKGDHERAIADFSEVIRLRPEDGAGFSNRGSAYERKGDLDRAIADYGDAIRLDPKNAIRYATRAIAYEQRSDYERAIADYSEGIRLNPKYAVMLLAYRGLSYDAIGDHERAIADYNAVISIDGGTDDDTFLSHGIAQSGKGDYDRAIDAFGECIRISSCPWRISALARRGLAYEAKGQLERAKTDFEAAVAVKPEELFSKGDQDRAREHLAALAQSAGFATAGATSPPVPQSEGQALVTTPTAEHRIALVIGNDRYPNLPADKQLGKATNDARAVGEALGRLGFQVITGTNLGRQGMIDKLSELTTALAPGDTAAFFYAGHGVAIGGVNYLVPSDIPRVDVDGELRVRGASIAEGDVVAELQNKGVRVALLVLDACRDNPFPRSTTRAIGYARGLADAKPARGIFTIYAAGIGQTALDGLGPDDPSRNSVFTRIFVDRLATPGADLASIAIDVRERVAELALTAKHEQTPAYYDQTIGGRVYLAGSAQPASAATK